MKIATWNIAGGHTAKSSKAFDYSTRNLNYFANQLATLNPDVLCLQEAEYELSGSLSLANYFAEQLNMPFVFETRMHASHITPGCGIALPFLAKNRSIQNEVSRSLTRLSRCIYRVANQQLNASNISRLLRYMAYKSPTPTHNHSSFWVRRMPVKKAGHLPTSCAICLYGNYGHRRYLPAISVQIYTEA